MSMFERANITYVHEINQLLLFQLDSKTIYNLVMFAVRLRKDIRSYVRNELMQFLSNYRRKNHSEKGVAMGSQDSI